MQAFLRKYRARRFGYDGWALQTASGSILEWSLSTNRAECRKLATEFGDISRVTPIKVRVTLEPLKPRSKNT